jgi:hypothetical protein
MEIMHSHKYLNPLVEHGIYIAVVRGPHSKRERAFIRDAKGHDWRAAEGAARTEVPIRLVKYYLDRGLLAGDGEDLNGSDVFRVTQAGIDFAKAEHNNSSHPLTKPESSERRPPDHADQYNDAASS